MGDVMNINNVNCAWNIITKILKPCPKEVSFFVLLVTLLLLKRIYL